MLRSGKVVRPNVKSKRMYPTTSRTGPSALRRLMASEGTGRTWFASSVTWRRIKVADTHGTSAAASMVMSETEAPLAEADT